MLPDGRCATLSAAHALRAQQRLCADIMLPTMTPMRCCRYFFDAWRAAHVLRRSAFAYAFTRHDALLPPAMPDAARVALRR